MHLRTYSWILPALLATACSGGGPTPTQPAATNPELTTVPSSASAVDPNTFGFAAADLTIDLAMQSASLTPVRSATAIGDDYSELGLTPAFNAMFGDNFEVVGLRSPLPGQVEVDVQITHPFSPAVRPDLGIFNVRCTLVTDRAPVNVGGVNIAPDVLANADGYSDSWQLTHPSSLPAFAPAPVQPYIILREDPSAGTFDFQNPAGYNVLFPGQTSTDTLTINIGTATTFQARLYLTADYGQSAVRATRQTPAYELPKFAGNAPWKIVVTELSNDLEQGQTGSSATYQVDIWDWKHGAGLGSDVDSATLSVPGVTTSPLTLSLSGTGTDPAPLTATTLVTNAANALEGVYTGLVTVTDTAQGIGLEENLATPVSFGSYTTYMTFPVAVDATVIPPVAAFTRCHTATLSVGIIETFDASTSTPGSNPIATYEWDFDYDGSNFTVDATGVSADHAFTVAGTPTVALRVSDGSPLGTDLETMLIAVNATPSWTDPPFRITNDTYWNRWEDQSRPCPVIGIDSTGTAHLVHYRSGGPFQLVHHTLSGCEGDWTVGDVIYSHASGSNFGLGLAVKSDDSLHVSFAGAGVNGVQVISKTGGTWGAPAVITTSPGSGGWNYGWLARDGADQLGFAALFQPPQNPAAVNGGGIPAVPSNVYFIEQVGGVWQPQALLGTADMVTSQSAGGGWSGRILSVTTAALPNGDWVVLWDSLKTPHIGGSAVSSACLTKWTRQVSGTFAPQSTLTSTPSDSFRDVLVAGPDGRLWWANTNIGTSTQLATYDGTTWTTPVAVLSGILGSAQPSITMMPDGEALLMSGGSSFGTAVTAKRFNQTDSIAAIAGTPTMTMVPAASGILQRFPVAMRLPDNRWTAVFQSTRFGAFTEGQELEAVFLQ